MAIFHKNRKYIVLTLFYLVIGNLKSDIMDINVFDEFKLDPENFI